MNNEKVHSTHTDCIIAIMWKSLFTLNTFPSRNGNFAKKISRISLLINIMGVNHINYMLSIIIRDDADADAAIIFHLMHKRC